eukprot:SM000129S26154  [mRNA]  locus=s129:285480:288979:+ [translate_table: standard]
MALLSPMLQQVFSQQVSAGGSAQEHAGIAGSYGLRLDAVFQELRLRLAAKAALQFAAPQSALEDVVYLHNLHLLLEDLCADGWRAFQPLRNTFLERISELHTVAEKSPEVVPATIRSLREFVQQRLAQEDPPTAAAEALGRGNLGTAVPTASSSQQAVDRDRLLPGPHLHLEDSHDGRLQALGSRMDRQKYSSTVQEACRLMEAVLGSQQEADLVGSGIRCTLADLFGKPPSCEDSSDEVQPVYYMTNRRPELVDEVAGEFYGSEVADNVVSGVVEVQCPGGRPQVKRDFQRVSSLDDVEFKAAIKQQIEKNDKNAVLLYIHGCFTDFARGMGYGAQIVRGLNLEGPGIVYSWPTVGRPSLSVGLGVIKLYHRDEQTCADSALHLRDILRMLSSEMGAKDIHIVAYSMGARALTDALRMLDPEDLSPATNVTSHIYFMAPDVTANDFSEATEQFRFPQTSRKAEEGTAASELPEATTEVVVKGGKLLTAQATTSDDSTCTPAPLSTVRDDGRTAVHSRTQEKSRSLGDVLSVAREAWGDASASIINDTVLAFRTAGQVWQEGRSKGWKEALRQVFTQEELAGDKGSLAERGGRSNSRVTLYAAENDIALLLSELMDYGMPQLRAGRKTKDFLLCRNYFDTVDVSALKTGYLTTGHFYLFHNIVNADIVHTMQGLRETPWWRQAQKFQTRPYFKLTQLRPKLPARLAAPSTDLELDIAPTINTSPIYWAAP